MVQNVADMMNRPYNAVKVEVAQLEIDDDGDATRNGAFYSVIRDNPAIVYDIYGGFMESMNKDNIAMIMRFCDYFGCSPSNAIAMVVKEGMHVLESECDMEDVLRAHADELDSEDSE